MKIAVALGLGLLLRSLTVLAGIALIGQFTGYAWASLTGAEPVWPSVLGFGALYGIALSIVVLAGTGSSPRSEAWFEQPVAAIEPISAQTERPASHLRGGRSDVAH